ncbi:MAG: adenine-specific DNA-methyltransferase [Patescibacteria group bacterium]|nr:adenine-specific DNA-methyltransferase [Patescibacteria group bacterium]
MEKLDLHSRDILGDNIERIGELFPGVITEIKDENGVTKKAVDFDLLRQHLSDQLVEGDRERFRLDWPGKRASILKANTPTTKTLRPVREDSVDFDTTQNVFIEGDNFEVLKVLQESYLGKIKMIYIDPPYNTGKDFIYKDNFTADKGEYEEELGVRDDESGGKLVKNTETNGRYHSDWLSMIQERLIVARDLLTDDGVIFISIDENELNSLTNICHDLFGESNYIATFIHKNNSSKNQAKLVSVSTEYLLCYARQKDRLGDIEWRVSKKGASDVSKLFTTLKSQGLSLEEIDREVKDLYKRPKYAHLSRWNKVDDGGVFKDADLSRENGPKDYTIINPHTGQPCPVPGRGWGKSKEELERLQSEGLIYYGNENTPPGMKDYITNGNMSVPDNFWYFDNSIDTRWIKDVFGALVFSNPKPMEMIKQIVQLHTKDNDIVLDFFAGSATTAHAVLAANAEDSSNRRFVMVQLPENLDEALITATDPNERAIIKNAIAYLDSINKPHYLTYVTKERIKLAAKDIEGRAVDKGFRAYSASTSNFTDTRLHPSKTSQTTLLDVADTIKSDRTAEDILIEVILSLGLTLDLPVEQKEIANHTVYFVGGNSLVACFDDTVSVDIVDEIAKEKPLRVVFKDSSFANDEARINIDVRMKQLSPDTEVKVL